VLVMLAERERQNRLRDLRLALAETDPIANPGEYRALQLECLRVGYQRPNLKKGAS